MSETLSTTYMRATKTEGKYRGAGGGMTSAVVKPPTAWDESVFTSWPERQTHVTNAMSVDSVARHLLPATHIVLPISAYIQAERVADTAKYQPD